MQTTRKLLDDCELWCIVSLPPGAFVNAGAGVKANPLRDESGIDYPTREIGIRPFPAVRSGRTPILDPACAI